MNRYAFLIIACTLAISCSSKKEEETITLIRPVKYGKVVESEDALSETFSGTAQSSKETRMSFKVSGTVSRLSVKIGDVVRKGQPIARIDQTDYSIQYEQSLANMKGVETQIQSANTQLISSKANYERVEKLYENNSLSISDFEQAKSAYESAEAAYQAAVAQAKATERQVESAKNQVNYANLNAPYTGVITMVNVEENEFAAAGNPIATISALDNPEISVGIPELLIARVRKGQAVQVAFSSLSGESFSGKVYEVGYSSLGGSTYPVTVRIDNPTADIRPGMTGDVRFNFSNATSDGSALLVAPVAAIAEGNDGHFAFVLKADGTAYKVAKQPVEIGRLTAAGFEVKSGLSKGELVATAGFDSLLDGMSVRLMESSN